MFSPSRVAEGQSRQVGKMHHRQQIFLVYDSFASSSISRTEFCLQENDRLSLPLCFLASFYMHFFLPYCSPLSLFTVLRELRSPKWHWAPFTSSFTLFYKRKAFFISFVIAYLAGKVVHFINRHLHLKKCELLLRSTAEEVKCKCCLL